MLISSRTARQIRPSASLALLALLAIVGCRGASKAEPMTQERRALHVASFDQVWDTIQDTHWDPTLNGVDWDAARAELRPRVEAAPSDDAARAAMSELIGRLGQSHFGVIPAAAYRGLDDIERDAGATTKPATMSAAAGPTTKPATADASPGTSGLRVRIVDGAALVTHVDAGSAGAAAGVRPGWTLERVGRLTVADVLKRVRAAHAGSEMLPAYEALTVQGMLDGDVGQTVLATFRNGANRRVRPSIVLVAPPGAPTKFGNLPTLFITAEHREVALDVGYVAFSAFFDPARVTSVVRAAVDRTPPYRGLVIDLRGNPGGIGLMANGISGYLVDQPRLKLGEMIMRDSRYGFVISPQPVVYAGPLAVIVDECSMSTSEIMAGGLQDLGRARVFGTPTPGAALPSRIERLPNGDGFQYAFANYISAKGEALEGKGVTPDDVVAPSRKALLAGKDPALDAAVRWLQSEAATRPAN